MQSHNKATTRKAPIKIANCHNSAVKEPPLYPVIAGYYRTPPE